MKTIILWFLDPLQEFSTFNLKDISGGRSVVWRDGSSASYLGRTSSIDEEQVTTYSSLQEAYDEGCGGP